MSKIHYIIYGFFDGTGRYYYNCSDESKSMMGTRLSKARIFNTRRVAQMVAGRLPSKWLAKPRLITGKKLFHAK